MPGDNAAMDVELIAECDGGEAAVCDPPGRQDRGRRRGGVDHGVRQDHKRLGYTETPLIPARKRAYAGNPGGPGSPPSRGRTELGTFAGYCMIALPPVSVFRLAMVLPFMHLQPCGGPRGRRKRFRRSVAQWLEHRSPNSALAIPANFITCYLVNIFGAKARFWPRLHTSPFYRVPSNWVAKMVASQ